MLLRSEKNCRKLKKLDDNSTTLDIAFKCVDKLDEAMKNKPKSNLIAKTFWIFVILCYSIISIAPMLFTLICMSVGHLEQMLNEVSTFKGGDTKTSDFKDLHYGITDLEYRADEYVASFGMSAYLVSGLNKLTTVMMVGGNTLYKKRSSSKAGYNLMIAMRITMVGFESILEEHGPNSGRYDKIRINIIKQMKNDDLPAEAVDHLLKQYKHLETELRAAKIHARKNGMMFELYSNVVKILLTGNGLLKTVMNGKADEHYKKTHGDS